MAIEYQVKWVARGGNQPNGKDWDTFLSAQEETLSAMGKDNWQLTSTLPVNYVGSQGTTLGGVLLYFQRGDSF